MCVIILVNTMIVHLEEGYRVWMIQPSSSVVVESQCCKDTRCQMEVPLHSGLDNEYEDQWNKRSSSYSAC